MKTVKRNAHIYKLLSIYSIKTAFQSKAGVVIFTIAKFFRFGMFFYFISFLVTKTQTLKGYSQNEAIVIYLMFTLIDTIAQIFFREVYRFRSLVVSGELDGVLIRPYHPFLRVLVGGMDPMDALALIPYLAITFYYISLLPHITTQNLLISATFFINGLVLAAGFHIIVLALAIITTNIDHAIMIYRDISSTARFPIEIYREPLRALITFVIPIGIMASYPSRALFGKLHLSTAVFALCVSGFFLYVAIASWNHALKRYQSWGG